MARRRAPGAAEFRRSKLASDRCPPVPQHTEKASIPKPESAPERGSAIQTATSYDTADVAPNPAFGMEQAGDTALAAMAGLAGAAIPSAPIPDDLVDTASSPAAAPFAQQAIALKADLITAAVSLNARREDAPQGKPEQQQTKPANAETVTTLPALPPPCREIRRPIATKARRPRPEPPETCFVHRGSNDRMILICNGDARSAAQVFRAVTEGESAFRGLREFDPPDKAIGTYGFNASRFRAMSQGPRDARDVTFLRSLRDAATSVHVKGRPFDLYLMKGDHSLATVLVERASAPERSATRLRA